METVGTVEDFKNAVDRIGGLDWLIEWDIDDLVPDQDFHDARGMERRLSGRLYLVMANQRGIDELLHLWRQFVRDENAPFPYGQTRLREVFRHLKDIRRWGVQDRLDLTGVIEYWASLLSHNVDPILCEVELWFRDRPDLREQAYTSLNRVVQAAGGQCVTSCAIPEIAYHSVLVSIPAQEVRQIQQNVATQLARLDDIVFFRPVGQSACPLPSDTGAHPPPARAAAPQPTGDPILALLDGLPQENHPLLQGRLVVDDPDAWAATYPVDKRCHGTAMASLLAHGDLNANGSSLPRPIYVRPILKPNPYNWNQNEECVPHGVLVTDLIARAVHRAVRGDGTAGPAAPGVRIINLSVCDGSRPFHYSMSPLGRLLDWLAWEHNLLFVVSAGNHLYDITLAARRQDLGRLTSDDIQAQVLSSLAGDLMTRRLLSPGEAVNALTIASVHDDASQPRADPRRINPYQGRMPSTYNALGLGYRRAIKPDILAPGGRLFLNEKLGTTHANATLTAMNPGATSAPGQLSARPGLVQAGQAPCSHTRGTSNATAVVSRHASLIYDEILTLRGDPHGAVLEEQFVPVLIKALLVHSASWGIPYDTLAAVLRNPGNAQRFREFASRFLGYGEIAPERTATCAPWRATAIGCSTLGTDQAHRYRIPLPPSLSARQVKKRLTVTLAWFTPINPRHRDYRKAHLWFAEPHHALDIERTECPGPATQRGTVQHEVFEGDHADAFADGDQIEIHVNCRADAGKLAEQVRYAIAVTLETAEVARIPVYEEIRARIQVPVRIMTNAG